MAAALARFGSPGCGAFRLDKRPAQDPQQAASASDAETPAAVEREIGRLQETIRELRAALEPLTKARGELETALAQAQEIRAAGRARAESVRAESLSRAQRIAERGEHRAQEILRRGILDAERIEAQSHSHAEEVVARAQQRLQGVEVSEVFSELEPPSASPGRALVEVAPPPEARTGRPPREAYQPRGRHSRIRDDAGPGSEPGPPGQAEEGDAYALWLSVSTIHGKDLRCRLRGNISFPGLLALERAVGALAGVESVWVGPDSQGIALAIVSEQPAQTVQDLLSLSGFLIRMSPE